MSDKKIPFEGARWEQENWKPEDSDHQGQLNSYLERLKKAEATIETQNTRISDLTRQLEKYRSRDSDYNKVLSGRDDTVKRLTAERDQARADLSDAKDAYERLTTERDEAAEKWQAALETAQAETATKDRELTRTSTALDKANKVAKDSKQLLETRTEQQYKEKRKRDRQFNRAITAVFVVGALGFFAFVWALAGTPVPWGGESNDNLGERLAACVYDLQNANADEAIGAPVASVSGILEPPANHLLGEDDRGSFPSGIYIGDITTDTTVSRTVRWSADVTLPPDVTLQGITINAYKVAPLGDGDECRVIWRGSLYPEDSIYISGETTRRVSLKTRTPSNLANIEDARWFFTNLQFDLAR